MTEASLSRRLIRMLSDLARDGLPHGILHKTRLHVADAVGISVGGRALVPLVADVLGFARASGGSGVCTVYGNADRSPPAIAAFCNSAFSHVLDFDDIHDLARVHPTTVTLPSALAAAQAIGAHDADIVQAVALGNELMCRLGVMYSPSGSGPGSDWFLTQLFGYFGSCLAASLVLGLSEDQIVAGFGFAYMQAAGGKEAAFGTGSTSRAIYPAFAAMGGTQAALLARAGLRGPETALDGDANLFKVYLGASLPADRIRVLLQAPETAEAWAFSDTDIKPWPSCRISHPYIAAALAVRAQVGDRPIESVVAAVNESSAKLCMPLAQRRLPRTLQDAKYSVPFMIAFTLVHGEASLSNLAEGVLSDERVLALAARVDIELSLPDDPGQPPAEISAVTGDGRFSSRFAERMRVPEAAIEAKFRACFAAAGLDSQASALWSGLRSDHRQIPVLLRESLGSIPIPGSKDAGGTGSRQAST